MFPRKAGILPEKKRIAYGSAKLMATTQAAPICARTLYDDELIDEMSAVKDTNKINARCIF